MEQRLCHGISPVFNHESKILILGSFPSVKSRESQFFYHHPQNRFWKVLATVIGAPLPFTIEDKKVFLLKNHIALWDVIAQCDITGSSDSSIKNVVPNDMASLLSACQIKKIYANGATAFRLYQKYFPPCTTVELEKLPSTSPANAAYSLEQLVEYWRSILQYITI